MSENPQLIGLDDLIAQHKKTNALGALVEMAHSKEEDVHTYTVKIRNCNEHIVDLKAKLEALQQTHAEIIAHEEALIDQFITEQAFSKEAQDYILVNGLDQKPKWAVEEEPLDDSATDEPIPEPEDPPAEDPAEEPEPLPAPKPLKKKYQ